MSEWFGQSEAQRERLEAMHAEPQPEKTGRHNYIGVPQAFLLDHACAFVGKALDETCYLVGSATQRMNFRDVDVRVIMFDAKFDALFGKNHNGHLMAFWSLLCTSISLYLSKATGLPVDFQIQRMSEANERHRGVRNAIGLFCVNEEDVPPWLVDPFQKEAQERAAARAEMTEEDAKLVERRELPRFDVAENKTSGTRHVERPTIEGYDAERWHDMMREPYPVMQQTLTIATAPLPVSPEVAALVTRNDGDEMLDAIARAHVLAEQQRTDALMANGPKIAMPDPETVCHGGDCKHCNDCSPDFACFDDENRGCIKAHTFDCEDGGNHRGSCRNCTCTCGDPLIGRNHKLKDRKVEMPAWFTEALRKAWMLDAWSTIISRFNEWQLMLSKVTGKKVAYAVETAWPVEKSAEFAEKFGEQLGMDPKAPWKQLEGGDLHAR